MVRSCPNSGFPLRASLSAYLGLQLSDHRDNGRVRRFDQFGISCFRARGVRIGLIGNPYDQNTDVRLSRCHHRVNLP